MTSKLLLQQVFCRQISSSKMAWQQRVSTALLAFIFSVISTALAVQQQQISKTPLIMPNVAPEKKDTYYCTGMKLNTFAPHYLTGFSPNASTGAAHHIIVHGCELPGAPDGAPYWQCDEMSDDNDSASTVPRAPACSRGGAEQVLYAWAHSAPSMELPEDVAFEVGGPTSRIQYLVVQVHYNDHILQFQEQKGIKDDSGVIVHHTSTPTSKRAGVWLFGSNGRLPPKRTEVVDMACAVEQMTELHPFAFRAHTHSHGKIVSAYVVHGGDQEWTLIGKQDPQKPQMFYPVSDTSLVIGPGDVVAARCVFENDEARTIQMGPSMDDEMCNFYLMYYTEQPYAPLTSNVCYSYGPPLVYWDTMRLPNIPDKHSTSMEGAAAAPDGDGHPHHHHSRR